MSTIRVVLLLVFLVSLYFMIRSEGAVLWIAVAIASAIAFFILIRSHMRLAQEMRMNKALSDINQNEHDYLDRSSIPFADGKEHITTKHAYTYDLDIFGDHSLFHRLNRTATYVGSRRLAHFLSNRLSNEDIVAQQQAIKEVSPLMEWRQELLAVAMTSDDSKKTYDTLIDWTNTEAKLHSPLMKIISFSHHIADLSRLFQQLDSVHNPMGAIIFNGMSLYHVHTIRKLQEWKVANASNISNWLEVIGEIEAINSLSNFAYNNPTYTFPSLNTNEELSFEELGHPMLPDDVRVCNDVTFVDQKFIILTGSNMSGKSTFLRSLGINMVLASAGAPICAQSANIHPLDIYVSMRLSDSLTDNESYFFAEVKRLKEVMDAADNKLTFILLDEILRGTNSDDKRQGTVEVIKKLISKNVIGAIATHDLKVCDTTADYPTQLINKNFEVEIQDGELVFDYKLRDGVCKNKSDGRKYFWKNMAVYKFR